MEKIPERKLGRPHSEYTPRVVNLRVNDLYCSLIEKEFDISMQDFFRRYLEKVAFRISENKSGEKCPEQIELESLREEIYKLKINKDRDVDAVLEAYKNANPSLSTR